MIAKDDIIGIVLAGGKSSRFGSNKALYIHEQQTLLEHSLQLLKPLCQQVYISGCYSEYQKFDVSCIPDLITNIGPLGGIYSAMKNFNSPYYLFLTCDMPFMEEALLQRLLTIESDVQFTYWTGCDNHLQLFPLLISHTLLPKIEQKITAQSYHIRSLIADSKAQSFPISFENQGCFSNINTPSDLDTK